MTKPTIEETTKFYKPPKHITQQAYIKSDTEYQQLYDQSINKTEEFWEKIAKENFFWKSTNWKVLDYNFDIKKGKVFVEYFKGGKTNICYNAIDRHLEKYGDKIAYYWQGNDEHEKQKITYKELHQKV
jgi:acetyl-CoA synthetase